MNIENAWEKLGEGDHLLDPILKGNLDLLNTKSPLKKIRKGLLHSIYLGTLFSAIYIFACVYYNIWQVNLIFGLLIIFNSWISITGYKLYTTINENIDPSNSLLEELQKNYWCIKQWWSIQERVSIFIYPFTVVGGFMLGGIIGSGKSLGTLFSKNIFIISLIIAIISLVPLSYWLARKMFDYAFGKHLKKIEILIKQLSEPIIH
ncbi:MAG: hypothetical protein NVS3B19_13880 [Ginsengibacter sp.]